MLIGHNQQTIKYYSNEYPKSEICDLKHNLKLKVPKHA